MAIVSVLALMAACGGEPSESNPSGPSTAPPPTGTVTPIVLAADQSSPWTIAVDNANVYWVNSGSDGGVFKLSKAGGTPVALDRGRYDQIDSIGLDDSTVYVPKGDKIVGLPIDGSQPRVVSTTKTAVRGVTARDGQIFWIDRGENDDDVIAHVDAGGGVATTLELPGTSTASTHGLVTTTEAVYVLVHGGPVRVPLDSSPASNLTGPVGTPFSFAVSGSQLFFGTTEAVSVVPTGGGEPTQLRALSIPPVAMAADDAFIYYAQFDKGLMKMPKSGGATTVVAANTGAMRIAVDETNLYWCSLGEGTIKKIAK